VQQDADADRADRFGSRHRRFGNQFWFTTPRHGVQTTISAGTWLVGTQVAAGTYRAENSVAGCEWQRLSGFSGNTAAIIGSGFASTAGAQLVTIAGTDTGFMTNTACGTWTPTGPATAGRRQLS
jgi:hypothetical protein